MKTIEGNIFENIGKVYFIGIGGIGMSAIARYFNMMGIEIFGYDKTESELTKKLEDEGMKIHYKSDTELIPKGIDLVVYTPAIPEKNEELQFFKRGNFIVKKRAEVLGDISRSKKTIAIAGTHGKTTVSAILTYILRYGGIDCTAFLGGIAKDYDSNFVFGESDWVVVEADEYDRSFLQLQPDIAGITYVDADHLDIYGDEMNMIETGFKPFGKKVKTGGKIFCRENLKEHFGGETFGLNGGTYSADNVNVNDGFFGFDYKSPVGDIANIKMSLPGRHNIENAILAIAIAQELGVKSEKIREALVLFKGIKRRFEIVFRNDSIVYIDDYAHHPTELKAAISAARELFPAKKLTGIFQPHYLRGRGILPMNLQKYSMNWMS